MNLKKKVTRAADRNPDRPSWPRPPRTAQLLPLRAVFPAELLPPLLCLLDPSILHWQLKGGCPKTDPSPRALPMTSLTLVKGHSSPLHAKGFQSYFSLQTHDKGIQTRCHPMNMPTEKTVSMAPLSTGRMPQGRR